MTLLSDNDWLTLSTALRCMQETTLERSLGDTTVTAKTLRVKHPWRVAMIVQIKVDKPHISWVQNFESVEEARRRYAKT